MVEINNKEITQYIYFPKSIKVDSNSFTLVIHSELSQVTKTFSGLTDDSNSNTYFKFSVDLSQENDGEYNYSIKDSEDNVISTGILRIGEIQSSLPEQISYSAFGENDEIIQYNSNSSFNYHLQTNKEVTVTSNDIFEITPDEGYDAMIKATVTVNVPTGHTDEELEEAYNEGREQGINEGAVEQKGKLVSTAVTSNGTFTRENGFNSVEVNVPQTGYTQQDLDNAYASGYVDGFVYGQKVNEQYLTFSIISGGTIITPSVGVGSMNIYYRVNDSSWTSIGTNSVINVSTNDVIQFKGNNMSGIWCLEGFRGTARFNAEGNIMSMIYGDNFSGNTEFPSDGRRIEGLLKFSSGLTSAEKLVLPATELGGYVYKELFAYCINMTKAPVELPATTLSDTCYNAMFIGCTSLTTAPKIKATSLGFASCYYMFSGCTSLTTAPELNAPVLTQNCYGKMFQGCSSLNYVKCLAETGINENNSTDDWLSGVSSDGTFIKKTGKEWNTGSSGIPSNWTVQEV